MPAKISPQDHRRTPANDRICASHLAADFPDLTPAAGRAAQVALPASDLLRAPDGARDRQLLCGESVTVFEERAGWSFVQASKDAYVGYLLSEHLEPALEMTHWICTPASHAYSKADFKSQERCGLSHGSRLLVDGFEGRFAATNQGFVPANHLAPLTQVQSDPVSVAELFLGTPYLWGGNSRWGIDCSGLVQSALVACGIPCPGDSDQQEAETGTLLPDGSAYQRGDLLFWKGHVAILRDRETLIHANAHSMAVSIESIGEAIQRIKAQGDGLVTSHKRLN